MKRAHENAAQGSGGIRMRNVLLAVIITGSVARVVLAQGPASPGAPAGTWSDGPLLGPAAVSVPANPAAAQTPYAPAPLSRSSPNTAGPPAATNLEAPVINIPGVEERVLPPSEQGPRSNENKKLPKIFRLPKPGGDNGQSPAGKLFSNRWKKNQLDEAPLASPEISGVTPLDERARSPNAPTAKRSANARKYGPLEILPKTKEGDRTGNPFSIRRPVLAW